MSEVQVDQAALKNAIKTTEFPHGTTCLVRRVTDTDIEAGFRPEVEDEWVMLPLAEITSFEVVRQITMTSGEYSLVKLGLQDEHPITEIEALRAQIRFMRENPTRSCGCGGRSGLPMPQQHAQYLDRQPSCLVRCDHLGGCAWWRCMWDCMTALEA